MLLEAIKSAEAKDDNKGQVDKLAFLLIARQHNAIGFEGKYDHAKQAKGRCTLSFADGLKIEGEIHEG